MDKLTFCKSAFTKFIHKTQRSGSSIPAGFLNINIYIYCSFSRLQTINFLEPSIYLIVQIKPFRRISSIIKWVIWKRLKRGSSWTTVQRLEDYTDFAHDHSMFNVLEISLLAFSWYTWASSLFDVNQSEMLIVQLS